MAEPTHPLLLAIGPLINRIGAAVVDPSDLAGDDIPLPGTARSWPESVCRLALPCCRGRRPGWRWQTTDLEPAGGWTASSPISKGSSARHWQRCDRPGKQRAVRMLEESGAFSYRKSVETVAAALGISRFTVYNYLNRERD